MTIPVRIKRSNVNGTPGTLLEGELAFSNDYLTHTGDGSLYVGADNDASGLVVRKIGSVHLLEKTIYNANTILAADTDDTPAALTIPEQTLVGRITAGTIDALTVAEVQTLLNIADGATADQNLYETFTIDNSDAEYTWAGTDGSVVADSTTDILTLVAGTNIVLDRDATNDALRITASGSSNQDAFSIVTGDTGTATADAEADTIAVTGSGGITTTATAGASAALSIDLGNITESQITDGTILARLASNESITGDWDFTSGTIVVPTPTLDTQATPKSYVDGLVQGLDPKDSVVAATVGNITLSGTQTIDGVSVLATERVLVKDQTAPDENGIYVCAAGAWARSDDTDTWAELVSAFVFVEEGTVNADTGWTCTVDAGGTLETTDVTWAQFSGAGSYTAGVGLNLNGTEFNVYGGLSGQVLVGQGAASNAAWGALDVANANAVTGILPSSHGGTGLATPATNTMLYGSGGDTMNALAAATGGTAGAHYILAQPADGGAPSWLTEIDGGTF